MSATLAIAGFRVDTDPLTALCRTCGALILCGRAETLEQFEARVKAHRARHSLPPSSPAMST